MTPVSDQVYTSVFYSCIDRWHSKGFYGDSKIHRKKTDMRMSVYAFNGHEEGFGRWYGWGRCKFFIFVN